MRGKRKRKKAREEKSKEWAPRLHTGSSFSQRYPCIRAPTHRTASPGCLNQKRKGRNKERKKSMKKKERQSDRTTVRQKTLKAERKQETRKDGNKEGKQQRKQKIKQ